MGKDFSELPFSERPDLSPYLVHLTKNTKAEDDRSAYENLLSILRCQKIWGSDTKSGFIKGPNAAACFMDVPFASLKYLFNEENSRPDRPRYEPFGVVVSKRWAYRHGCRPVLYLSRDELRALCIPKDEWWRVVTFQVDNGKWTSWLHEREWRCKGDFLLAHSTVAVLVKDLEYADKLRDKLAADKHRFKAMPHAIIPLSVVCQGLIYLPEQED